MSIDQRPLAAPPGAAAEPPGERFDWREEPITRELVAELQRDAAVETRAFVKPIFKWMKTGVRKSGQRNDVAVDKAFAFVAWMEQLKRDGDGALGIAPQPQLDATYALNTIVTSAQRASSRAEAERAIEMLKAFGYTPDVFAYTALIDVVARSRDVIGAFQRYDEMRASSATSRPNLVVFLTVIRAVGFSDEIPVERCLVLMDDARRDGVFDDSLYVRTIELCAKRRSGEVATRILRRMSEAGVDWKHQQPILRALQRVLQRIDNADAVLHNWQTEGFVTVEDVAAIRLATSMMQALYTRGASALGCARHVSESARHAVMHHAIDRIIERHLQGARITTSEFDTLIHQCRKRKRKDDVAVILDAMREISSNGWTLNTKTGEDGGDEAAGSVVVIEPLPQFAPNSATYAAVVETFLACDDEESAWQVFVDATTKDFVRDQLLYRKYIRGCCLLMKATHIVELLGYAREDGIVFTARMQSDLAKLHGYDHLQGVDVVLCQIPIISAEEKRLLLDELASSCAACQNTEGVMAAIEAGVSQGYDRTAVMDLAVLESCLYCPDVESGMVLLREFQKKNLLLATPVYASLLREIFFKCTRSKGSRTETGGSQSVSRRPALKMLHLRRGFVETIAALQQEFAGDNFTDNELAYESNDAAIQYWANHASPHAPMMFVQHVLEATATVVDKAQRVATSKTIETGIRSSGDPLQFVIQAVLALPALSMPFRAQGKLAKQLFGALESLSYEIQSHHIALYLNSLDTLNIYVVKELDDALNLTNQPGGLNRLLTFCESALLDRGNNTEKIVAFLLGRPALCSADSCAFLTPTFAQLYVHEQDAFVLKYFKPSKDAVIESQSLNSRRNFLREVRSEENDRSQGQVRLSRRAIIELKLEHEAEFLPLLMSHSVRMNNSPAAERELDGDSENGILYLSLPIAASQVIIVDDDDSLQFAYEVLVYNDQVTRIALDAEWRPTGRASNGNNEDRAAFTPCALLQIACESHVFLFDLLVLDFDDLEELFSVLFEKESILKLGFRLDGDLQRLRLSYPDSTCFDADEIKNVVDLATGPAGLSSIVEAELGLPLDKSQQCSDWEQRPLTKKQIEYAALDAYCLLMLHDRLTATP